MPQDNINVTPEIDFEYIKNQCHAETQKLMIVQHAISDPSKYKKEMKKIAEEGQRVSKRLILQNKTVKTKTLYNRMRVFVEGNQIRAENDARDHRGRAYAGHIEYGFVHHKSGRFIGPWPFIRPMIQYVQGVTKGRFEPKMLSTFEETWNVAGYGLGSPKQATFARNADLRSMSETFGSSGFGSAWTSYGGYLKNE